MRLKLPVLTLTCTLILGCTATPDLANSSPSQPANPVPTFIAEKKGCAILVGGSVGSAFDDAKVADFWFKVNQGLTSLIYDKLVQEQYSVVKLIVEPDENSSVERLIINAIAKNKCNHIIQLANIVNQDEQGGFFRYDVEVLHLAPKSDRPGSASGTNVTMVSDYARSYRYPRTAETFQTFKISSFAATVYSDMKAKGALEALH